MQRKNVYITKLNTNVYFCVNFKNRSTISFNKRFHCFQSNTSYVFLFTISQNFVYKLKIILFQLKMSIVKDNIESATELTNTPEFIGK